MEQWSRGLRRLFHCLPRARTSVTFIGLLVVADPVGHGGGDNFRDALKRKMPCWRAPP